MKKISIVVPAYNEAENLPLFHDAIADVFKHLPYELEFVFVNDGSTDGSSERLAALAASDPRVQFVEFVHNAGQQAATAAGLTYATGDAAIMMDADLQHPPRYIPEFLTVWEAGGKLVFGVRKSRPGDSVGRRLVSKIFGALYNAGTGLPSGVSDFSLIDRSVLDLFKKLPPDRRMTRVRLAHLPSERRYVYYDIDERAAGERKYTARKLVKLFADNMLKTKPLPAGETLYGVKSTTFSHD